MATLVIKKDMSKEKFDRRKIAKGIQEASKRADVKAYKAKQIADKVSRKVEREFKESKEIKSTDIRTHVLRELEKENSRLADEFRCRRKGYQPA